MSEAQRGRGRFQATREAFGFVVPEEGDGDIYIPAAETAGALHRDRVEFAITRLAERHWRAQGTILRILERGFQRFTGVVQGTRKRPYLVPDHARLPARFRLVGTSRQVEPGQRLLCELHEGGRSGRPAARVIRILGDADDAHQDTEIVIAEFGLPGPYPAEAEAEAHAFRAECACSAAAAAEPGGAARGGALRLAEDAERRDFSGEAVLTIDPADARDFDDAVSVASLGGGVWRVRVHIADVTVAVPAQGALDREARARGNSTYLPGRMIPMLPEVLAADLMSLSPGERKRVVSISARISDTGAVLGTRVDLGWIISQRRFDYDQVLGVLEQGLSVGAEWDARLRELDAVAQLLRRRRFARGSLDLDVPEVTMKLDARGIPTELGRRRSTRSHQLIEELMILANRIACSHARRHAQPYLYRVHAAPNPLALEEFAGAVRTLAPQAQAHELADLPAIRRWLSGLPAGPLRWRIHTLFLQVLQRAVYVPRDRGHFGLGLRGYGHFTSPIRRYADLYNHRIVKWVGRYGARPVPHEWRDGLEELARACSASEETSERAERMLSRIKILRWAEERLGQSFRGRIVAVLPPGYIVEFDDVPVEGFVPRAEADVMVGAADTHRGVGPGVGGLQMGDAVITQIGQVDRRERRLQLILRAAGRRAESLDPSALEALVDEREQLRRARVESGRRPRARARRQSAPRARGRRRRR